MMQTGALIVAAGKSSRMGDFKPMLQLGSISIAQRVINNFRQAGISKIVVVTGYNADALERHLASNHVIFLRNEDYETTHMFDSVRIGNTNKHGVVKKHIIYRVDDASPHHITIYHYRENNSRSKHKSKSYPENLVFFQAHKICR